MLLEYNRVRTGSYSTALFSHLFLSGSSREYSINGKWKRTTKVLRGAENPSCKKRLRENKKPYLSQKNPEPADMWWN